MRLPPFNPYIAVTIGVLSVSTTSIFVLLANQAPTEIIAFYRLFFPIIFMIPFMWKNHRHEFKVLRGKEWLLTILAGLLLSLHFIFWFESLSLTTIASTIIFITLQPIFMFIVTYILYHERVSAGAIISVFIALLGSFIIGWGDSRLGNQALIGDIIAIFSAIMLTIYYLFGQKVRPRLPLITYLFIVYSIGALILLFYNVLLQQSFTGYSFTTYICLLLLAVIPTFCGQLLFNWALRWVNSSTVSIGMILVPVITTILAYIIFDEHITYSRWLGGTIVIFGLFLFTVSTTRKRYVTLSHKNK